MKLQAFPISKNKTIHAKNRAQAIKIYRELQKKGKI